MGLDMYLSKRTYVQNWDHNPPERKVQVTVLKGGSPHSSIKPERVSNIIEEVAYWRKANAIHGWFVREVQGGVDDCRESRVDKEQIAELVGICEEILLAKQRKGKGWLALAKKNLPPTEGFFFGSSVVDDEYYCEDLRLTVRQLKPLLEETDEDSDGYYYRASW